MDVDPLYSALEELNIKEPQLDYVYSVLRTEAIDLKMLKGGHLSDDDLRELKLPVGIRLRLSSLAHVSGALVELIVFSP